MTIKNRDLFTLDQIIGRYVGAIPQNASDEMRKVQVAVLERVRRYTKFSYALGRNLSLMKPAIEAVQLAFANKGEKWEAYQNEMAAVAKDNDTTQEEKEKKYEEVREKHNAQELHAENAQREAELLDMEVTREDGKPFRFYRIPMTCLPGWNDPDDCPDEDRMGAVIPTDIATLINMGILYDPEDETDPS